METQERSSCENVEALTRTTLSGTSLRKSLLNRYLAWARSSGSGLQAGKSASSHPLTGTFSQRYL